ncbi:MAG: tRNA pseudouridine(54/55) synthase Pus10 [Promethearchaeota archaeon]
MTIFNTVLEIYKKYSICTYCLGRMFSLLGTSTTNLERGKSLLLSITMESHGIYLSRANKQDAAIKDLIILAEKANFLPAQQVLKKEGFEYSTINSDQSCFLCNDIFSNLQKYAEKAKQLIEGIEFNNFLVGTSPDSQIINREDNFKAKFNLLEAESFKSHFNREVGKIFSTFLNKPAEFINPDLLVIYSLGFDSFKVNITTRSIFIYGRYNKLIRGIPQTHWTCKNCFGKGCESCNFTGKKYSISVEELISPEFAKETKASSTKFHGAGREDIDVLMLGNGRPFILEIRNPVIRTLDLEKIKKQVNEINAGKIYIKDLKFSSKKEVINIKAEAEQTRKVYKALTEAKNDLNLDEFTEKLTLLKNKFENKILNQRTPFRVAHRRADKIRKKMVFKIDGKYIKPNLYEFIIETQGGTYIKELINGDNGRTPQSFAEIFGPLNCKELDVIKIYNE